MSANLAQLHQALENRTALKVISGLNNFDSANVLAVARAAQAGGATFVDIAADRQLIQQVRHAIDLPICVSAVEAELLAEAVAAGADLGDIGNFDRLYAQGRRVEGPEVLALTKAPRQM